MFLQKFLRRNKATNYTIVDTHNEYGNKCGYQLRRFDEKFCVLLIMKDIFYWNLF